MSAVVVPGLTPVMSRRLPRPAARSSSASVTREVPPVNTTMPSALRSSTTSFGSNKRKVTKPSTSAAPPKTTSLTKTDLMRRVLTAALRLSIAARVPPRKFLFRPPAFYAGEFRSQTRWRPVEAKVSSVHGLQSAIDGAARGKRRHERHEDDLQQDRQIAGDADGKDTEQTGDFVPSGSPGEPGIGCFRDGEQQDRRPAADGAAFEAEEEEMALKLPGHEAVGRAHIMQHLDDWAICRHGPACCEGDRQNRYHPDQRQHGDPGHHGGPGHGAHAIDPAAMVIEARRRNA